MARFIIAPIAKQDIASVLTWTEEHFGEQARLRYEALLVQAIIDVSNNLELPGSHSRPEIAAAARTYHLFHSCGHVAAEVGRVRRPRHFLLYRTRGDGVVEIGRVLHDSVDLTRHLPDEYRVLPGGDI
jgi:toxin ParE1/3/4